MYEARHHAPLSTSSFLQRMVGHGVAAILLLAVSLGAGILGYMHYEHLSAMDAFLNAAMLLGGMGPVNPPATDAGKLFAGCYALYAGLVFIVTAAIMLTPVLHRLLHRFHWPEDGGGED
jgi:hypothetical protein